MNIGQWVSENQEKWNSSESVQINRKRNFAKLLVFRREHPEEYAAAQSKGLRESPKAQAQRKLLHSKEGQVKAVAKRALNPRFCKTEQHVAAREWSIKDPNGRIHIFRNLAHWIRANPSLFDPVDVAWDETYCRAHAGIARIRPDRLRPIGRWKNWTWHFELSP